jgi:cytochrome c-type biogenesis protein CcmH
VPAAIDAAAVAAMSPEDRERIINGMVERLARRLASDGRDAKGWMMLIRAYQMLGRREDAERAVKDARRGLEGDAAALSGVDGLAKELGLGG